MGSELVSESFVFAPPPLGLGRWVVGSWMMVCRAAVILWGFVSLSALVSSRKYGLMICVMAGRTLKGM